MKRSVRILSLCMTAGILLLGTRLAIAAEGGMIKTLEQGIPHSAFFGVTFNEGVGYAVGAGAALYRSDDAGQTWKSIEHKGATMALLAVDSRGSNVIAVGQAGEVMYLNPQGEWSKGDAGTGSRLFSVSVNRAGQAIAVGEFGTVIKSLDGGRTWSNAAPNWQDYAHPDHFGTGEPNVYSAYITEDGVATIAGEFGVIVQSSDMGETWETIRTVVPGEPTIIATYFPRNGEGAAYAVGQSGQILVSQDGGKNWESRQIQTQSNFLGVAAKPGGEVVATGMRIMYRSTDGGNTWTPIEEGDTVTDWYQAIRLEPTRNKLIAVGHSGKIIQVGS